MMVMAVSGGSLWRLLVVSGDSFWRKMMVLREGGNGKW